MSPLALALILAMLFAGAVLITLGVHTFRYRPQYEAGEASAVGWCGLLSSMVALPGVMLVGGAVLVAALQMPAA
ncbi:hypothetical protein GCM10022200_14240 [Microbacterium awajiense]|uniref:Uncharacterized protein n=1 Tax=Microbacterium awajiense TaxID=415214 RepID=A0ABP7AHN8_9MICO